MRSIDKDIAEVLDGFEEEMLASIRRNRRPKAEVLQFPVMSEERRDRVLEQDRERVERLINEQRREAGLPSLEEARQMRQSLEYERTEPRKLSGYDPMKLFEKDTKRTGGCHRGPLDSDSDL